jgi:hypothetical protein
MTANRDRVRRDFPLRALQTGKFGTGPTLTSLELIWQTT